MAFKKSPKTEPLAEEFKEESPIKKAGRPYGTAKNKGVKKNVAVQLNEEEYIKLKSLSSNSGMSMATYIKHKLLYSNN